MGKAILLLLSLTGLLNTAFTQWEYTNGPEGGFVNCLSLHESKICAGTTSGYYISENNGDTWSIKGFVGKSVSNFEFDGSNVFLSTWDTLFLSNDLGITWNSIQSGLPPHYPVMSLKVVDSIIFAATYDGVFRSSNYGQSWENVGLADIYVNSLVISGSEIFAGTLEGIFLSTDDGNSWQSISNSLPTQNINCVVADNGGIYLGTDIGLFRSSDYGNSWVNQNPISVKEFLKTDSILYIGSIDYGLLYSSDDGTSWSNISSGIDNFYITDIVKIDNTVFMSNHTGINRKNSFGENWQKINNGLRNSSIADMISTETSVISGVDMNGISISSDNGTSWNYSNSGLNSLSIYSLSRNGTKLCAATGCGVYLSIDDGSTWMGYGLSTPHAMEVALNDSFIFSGNNNGLYRCSISGGPWTFMNVGTTSVLSALEINGSNIYAGFNGGGIFISTDNGNTWNSLNSGLGNSYIKDIVISGVYTFVATDYGIYSYNENDGYWTFRNSGINNLHIISLKVVGEIVLASTEGGVYLSYDYGLSWQNFNDGLDNITVSSFCFFNDKMYAGTFGNSVFSRSVNDILNVYEESHPDLKLYPNPNNGIFNISSTSNDIITEISIFNIQGQLIYISDEIKPTNKINISGRGKGEYIVHLKYSDSTEKIIKILVD